MDAVKGLLKSRKGLFALLLVATSTGFVIAKIMDVGTWAEYTKAIFVTFIGGHAIQESVTAVANRPKTPAAASSPNTVVVNQPEVR